MAEEEKLSESTALPGSEGGQSGNGSRFPDLEDLQREIDRRLRDNRRFLERFLDEEFKDEEGEEDEEDGEDFEEL